MNSNNNELFSYNIKEIRIIHQHSSINSMCLLNDKRIATCSYDKSIRIYSPSTDYQCNDVIQRHTDDITSICQLNNGTIVSCSNDKSIIIGEHIINNAHDDWIIKVISLPNNRIASCSWDETIKIWTLSSDIPFKVLKGHQDRINSILYVKEKDILISGSLDNTLRMWNMSTYQCMSIIEGVSCIYGNALYMNQVDKS